MKRVAFLLIAIAAVAGVVAARAPQPSARDIRGPSPYVTVENEPPPKLITHQAYPGQTRTVKFSVPKSASAPH